MNFEVLSKSPENTLAIGRCLGLQLHGDEIVLVSGELGAGKTIFIKGLAAALGIPADEVVSPSYVLMNLYSGRHDLYHFDLYRLGLLPVEVENPVAEYIGDGIVAVEWAQYLAPDYFTQPKVIAVTIESASGKSRCITVRSELNYITLS